MLYILCWSLLSSHEVNMSAQHKTEFTVGHLILQAIEKWLRILEKDPYLSHHSFSWSFRRIKQREKSS